MIETLAKELAAEIRRSKEYEAYAAAKEKALADEQTAALLKRFHKLQMTVQARRMAGAGRRKRSSKSWRSCCSFPRTPPIFCWRSIV